MCNPLCHYIVVRSDIPVGVTAAMIAHAAGESSTGDLDPGTYAIVLTVKSEKELQEVFGILEVNKVDFTPIYEPDPPWNNQLMALGLKPILRNAGRKFLSCLPSYKGYAAAIVKDADRASQSMVAAPGGVV